MFLTPVMLYVSWSIFILSSKTVMSLVALLFTSLGLPLMYSASLKIFWPCGLFLILMATGLIVIFAYMVSLHPSDNTKDSKMLGMATLMLSLITLSPQVGPSLKVFHPGQGVTMSPLLSFLLILLLLFLVVAFIRVVYSKGGGFRKKF